jgi:peptidoglycan/LPS O-acetylase OafA/YrhL
MTDQPANCVWMGYARTIGPAWSIGMEIWFYLLAPYLLRMRLTILAGVMIGGLALRSGLDLLGENPYYFFPAQLPLFIFGALAYRIGRAPTRVFAATGVALVICGCVLFGPLVGLDERYKWLMYVSFAFAVPSLFNATKRSRFDRAVGELSYPIYLTHWTLLNVVGVVCRRVGIRSAGELAAVVTVVVSFLLFNYVDRPISGWRERFAGRRTDVDESEVADGPAVQEL